MINKQVEHYNDGRVKTIKYLKYNDQYGLLHRENGPAYINYYDNGNIQSKIYYNNDTPHRKDGPAVIEYYDNGNKSFADYRINGIRHKLDGPSVIFYDRNNNIDRAFWYYKGWDCTREVDEWMVNKFNKWQDMSESDFNQMWMEIL